MITYLDPTIYIIDTETDFYICTKEKNLKLVLEDVYKNKVYKLIEELKKDGHYTSSDNFEMKIRQLLLDKGILTYQNKNKEIDLDGLSAIVGPIKLLETVKEEFGDRVHLNEQINMLIIHNSTKTDPIYVSVRNNNMCLSSKMFENTMQEKLNDEYLTYAGYVLLEQLRKKTFQIEDLSHYIVAINLDSYENTVRKITLNQINYKNFKSSVLFDRDIINGTIDFDYHSYFPFICIRYNTSEIEKELFVFGLSEEDAINNLLHLLSNLHDDIDYLPIEKVSLEKIDTLLKKLIYIKLQKKLEISEIENMVHVFIGEDKYSYPSDSNFHPISYALSLYFNEMYVSKGREALV
ncbi:hypothetical protein [Sutcliffiella rhizosphaerae]|uniref:DUF4868 domain-containing protein n=1 Tax=Sutcliffiella rhizosphaerae TaxID=2880967 RepID=A0ABM8YMS1_9BACI|nr:hypothetical protein [Sutcliffiella rhizosphaerae]CAG9621197.1 hypothetical protein BACCIP111883_01969 [Sutcliffiella rhizosphaerae]